MQTVSVAPQGFWVKTHFYREGMLLHAVTYSCIAGDPEIFRFSLDLKPIVAAVAKYHNQLHQTKVSGEEIERAIVGYDPMHVGGVFDFITKPISNVAQGAAKLANKIGKSKLVSQVGSAVKGVVRSKITSGVLMGVSVAFPAVGVPALAAQAGANKALDALESPKKMIAEGKKAIDKHLPPAVRDAAKAALTATSNAILKEAKDSGRKIPDSSRAKGLFAKAMIIAKERAAEAKKLMGGVAARAKKGDIEAQKLARVVVLTKSARDKLETLKHTTVRNVPGLKSKPAAVNLSGFPALLVTDKGMIVPGRYVEKAAGTAGRLIRGGKIYRGKFSVVSGDRVFGDQHLGSIGCSNPFLNKPAHLR